MRIGFDAKRLFLNYTGLGNYSRTLVSNLQRFYPQHEYHLYTTKTTKNKDTEEFFDTSKYTIHECHSSLKSYWRSYSIVENLKNDGIDIYHGLSAEIPFGIDKSGIKTVVTIHDLIFKFFKKDYTLIDRMLYNLKTKYACNHADKIIAISKKTKDDILNIYGIDPKKIEVVYLPANGIFRKDIPQQNLIEVKNKFKLPDRYFLYVGSIIGRKNLKTIINAMSKIDISNLLILVVVGTGMKYLHDTKELISKYNLEEKVLFLPQVSNIELPSIYRLSEFFVFPSLYEGFGLPVLEAIISGKPVIVTSGTSLEEVADNCGLKLPPNDIEKWSEAILKLTNRDNAYDLKKNCDKHLKKFDPEYLSKLIIDQYEKLMNVNLI